MKDGPATNCREEATKDENELKMSLLSKVYSRRVCLGFSQKYWKWFEEWIVRGDDSYFLKLSLY